MKFLILDYNEDFYPIYRRKLEGLSDTDIKFCKNQLEANEACLLYKPDCILISHLLEKTYSSYDFFRKLGYKGDIIILVPGKDKFIKRNFYNGISGILDKFLNREDFQSRLTELLTPLQAVKNHNITQSKVY